MEITKEVILKHMATIEKQLAAYQGAYQLCEQLLKEAEKNPDDMSVDEFAEMVGGKGASASIHPVEQ